MKVRFYTLALFFITLYVMLGVNLYDLQIQKGDYFTERVNAMKELNAALQLRRGQIFITDRTGEGIPLAINKDEPIIFISPKEVTEREKLLEILPTGIGIDAAFLKKALENKESSFKLLVEKATDDEIAFIKKIVKEDGIKGIYTDTKQYRYYAFQSLASQLSGFVGFTEDNDQPVGLYGIEKMYDDRLAGGDSVYLTIDRTIQTHVEQVLEDLMKNYDAVGGTVIVEEPKTGKIISLASKPDFDPNEYKKYPIKSFLNPAVQLVYEPGSVMKPFTMAAGIETGVITPDTTFVDKGSVTMNGRTIRNANDKVYGKITMTQVIENSVNTGAIFAEQQVGHSRFVSYLKKFGFGEKTNIDIPDEIGGSLKNLERSAVRDIDFATASFGQGTSVTPLQLANAFSTIANGGLLMKPFVSKDAEPYVVRRVVSEDTTKKITAMLESTVEKAKIAAIPQYRVAGKTGTAYIPDFTKGGYTEEMMHTFVGFAPASDPQFVVLVKLEKPQVGELAGMTVVPAFRDIAQYIINYYHIPPDKLSVTEQ